MDFAVLPGHTVKSKESEKRDKYLDFAKEQKKTMEHEVDGDKNNNLCTWNKSLRIFKGTGKLRNKRIRGDHLDYSIMKIG